MRYSSSLEILFLPLSEHCRGRNRVRMINSLYFGNQCALLRRCIHCFYRLTALSVRPCAVKTKARLCMLISGERFLTSRKVRNMVKLSQTDQKSVLTTGLVLEVFGFYSKIKSRTLTRIAATTSHSSWQTPIA